MVSSEKITANTSFFMIALVIQKILSFVYFTILARILGPESMGQYFFAVSFATMFSVLIDLGLSPLLIREVARVVDADSSQTEKEENTTERWFQQIFSLKLIFAAITALLVILLDLILFFDDAVRNLIFLTTTIIVIDSFTLFFYAFIRGKQNLKFESWGTIIFQFIIMTMGLSLLQVTDNVFLMLTVLFTASFFNMIYSGVILYHKFNLKLKWLYSKDLARGIMQIAMPFALAAIFAKIYAYIDTFLLKMFMGDEAVGFYSVAYKITFSLQFIPLAFVASLYPAFSNYFKTNKDKLTKTFAKSFNYLAFVAIPIAFGIVALAEELVHSLYTGQYFYSIWPLKVLIASIPFLFINFSLSSFLNATERQKINTKNLGIVMALNIILNTVFIPELGIWGASLASSISTVLLFALNLRQVMKVVSMPLRFFKPLLGVLFSSIVMYFAVVYAKDYVAWPLSILVGILVYIFFSFVTKTIKKDDILFIKNSFRS